MSDATAGLDRIELRGIEVHGHHGVFDHERRNGQRFLVDARLWLDTRPAAASDDLVDAVDYSDVVDRLAAVVAGEPVDLVEALAARLAAVCLADPRVAVAEVTVHKPDAPVRHPVADLSVTIRRTASGSDPR